MNTFRHVLAALAGDKLIKTGAPSAGLTLWGGHELARVREWLAFYATASGCILTTMLILYTALKIYRLLNNPRATE